MEETIIMKVWENSASGQLLITIPKKSNIQKGDYVRIKKIKEEESLGNAGDNTKTN